MPLDPLQALKSIAPKPGSAFTPSHVLGGYYADEDENGIIQPEPTIALQALQDQRKTELQHNLANRGGGFYTGGNEADLGSLEDDMQKNPLTAQKAQGEMINHANDVSRLHGFLGGAPVKTGPSSYASNPSDQPAQAEAHTARMAEMAKAAMPQAVAQTQGQSSIEAERLKQAGAEKTNQFLMDFLSRNPDANIHGPGGVAVSHPSPAQSVAPGSGKDTAAELRAAQARRQTLDHPGWWDTPASTFVEKTGIGPQSWTPENQKKVLDERIQTLQKDLGQRPRPAASHGGPQTPGPTQVIPQWVSEALAHAGPGRHKFSDGTVWISDPSGNISRVQ